MGTLKRLAIDGNGQLELNLVSFPTTGRIEAMSALDPKQFFARNEAIPAVEGRDGTGKILCENGMILAINPVKRTIEKYNPEATDQLLALNYSSEHIYDTERNPELRNFCLYAQPVEEMKEGRTKTRAIWPGYDFFPRLGYLSMGEKYTTNCLCYDTSEFHAEENLIEALKTWKDTELCAVPTVCGAVRITKDAPTIAAAPLVLKVVKYYTMPDGQKAVKLQVIRDRAMAPAGAGAAIKA